MPSKPKLGAITLVRRGFDLIAIVACFGAAGGIATLLQRRGLFVWPDPQADSIGGGPPHYAALLIASLLVWAAVSGYTGVYQSLSLDLIHQSFSQLLRAIALWA